MTDARMPTWPPQFPSPKPGSSDWWRLVAKGLLPANPPTQIPTPERPPGLWRLLHGNDPAPTTMQGLALALQNFPAWGDWTEAELTTLWKELNEFLPRVLDLAAVASGGKVALGNNNDLSKWHMEDCPRGKPYSPDDGCVPDDEECTHECNDARTLFYDVERSLLGRFLENGGRV